VNSLQDIENAITGLSAEDRATLIRDLPRLFPECEGDLKWQAILHDPTPSPALSRLADSIDAEFARNPESFPEIRDSDFEAGR
jgi:hypothetical protein